VVDAILKFMTKIAFLSPSNCLFITCDILPPIKG
jgi:hypothetical protein